MATKALVVQRDLHINNDFRKEKRRKRRSWTFFRTLEPNNKAAPNQAEEANNDPSDNIASQKLASVTPSEGVCVGGEPTCLNFTVLLDLWRVCGESARATETCRSTDNRSNQSSALQSRPPSDSEVDLWPFGHTLNINANTSVICSQLKLNNEPFFYAHKDLFLRLKWHLTGVAHQDADWATTSPCRRASDSSCGAEDMTGIEEVGLRYAGFSKEPGIPLHYLSSHCSAWVC